MNLERLLQSKKRELEEESADDTDLQHESESDEADDDEAQGSSPNQSEPEQRPQSYDELLQENNRLKAMLSQTGAPADYDRSHAEQRRDQAPAVPDHSNVEAMLRSFEAMYAKNPMHATAWLIGQAKLEAVTEMEDKISGLLKHHRAFGKLMGRLFKDPAFAHLTPYQEEMEFLIEDVGLSPRDAAKFIQTVATRRDEVSAKRTAASRAVRNRAAVESDGAAGEPVDKEKDLDAVLKKSKTLEEMFAGLSKLKI